MHMRELLSNDLRDESIYIFARPYFLAFLPWFLVGLGLVFAGVIFVIFIVFIFPSVIATTTNYNAFVLMASAYFLLIIPFMTVGFIDYYYDLLIVTDRRLMDVDQNSLFSRNVSELALEQIEDVSSPTSGILNTLFDYGDVIVQSAGARERFVFKSVRHPREITQIILDLSDQAKQRIERGLARISPVGTVKAVINGRVITDLRELVRLGAFPPVGMPPSAETESGDDLAIVIDQPD